MTEYLSIPREIVTRILNKVTKNLQKYREEEYYPELLQLMGQSQGMEEILNLFIQYDDKDGDIDLTKYTDE